LIARHAPSCARALLLTVWALALLAIAVACGPPTETGTLIVRVGRLTPVGHEPGPNYYPGGPTPIIPLPTPTPPGFPGVHVQIVNPQSLFKNVVADQVTDAQGLARFALSPGQYWADVPWGDPGAEAWCQKQCPQVPRPDGAMVYWYADATITAGTTWTVSLPITFPGQ
jgi:hypothetical protein